jgi:hypothetical protein
VAQRAATIQEVRDRLGPAFTDPPITDTVVQLYLTDTACLISPAAWGECASTAHAYAAAHCVASSPYAAGIPVPAGMGPLVSGEANGPASRSIAVPSPPDGVGSWWLTGWGRKFIEYRLARWGCGSATLARTSRSARRAC